MNKVTGIGGIFFKCKDPDKIKDWYKEHLGFEIDTYGAKFDWKQTDNPSKNGYTVWSPFTQDTEYLKPSTKDFMINYRVENIENLVLELKKESITVLDEIEEYEGLGKFVHILDIEGNKIELWEPAD